MTPNFQIYRIQKQIAIRLADGAIHPFQIVFFQRWVTLGDGGGTVVSSPDSFGDFFHLSGAEAIDQQFSNGSSNLVLSAVPSSKQFGDKSSVSRPGNGNIFNDTKSSRNVAVAKSVSGINSINRSLTRCRSNKRFQFIINGVNDGNSGNIPKLLFQHIKEPFTTGYQSVGGFKYIFRSFFLVIRVFYGNVFPERIPPDNFKLISD